ncbi:MAG TPA: plastocyanin/azurin family copper-binding protein, partial [Ferruginibacter sp.]|nr:plastocyanin/azurin family copper-binding protein [Ferruginibacter sp.]
ITNLFLINANGKKTHRLIENTVVMQNMQFQPSTITVVPGSEIVWINKDSTAHSVVSDNGTTINSGSIGPNGSFSFTTTQVGSITYHCGSHAQMKGTIQVITNR